ncbi:protein-glutamine glutaminase family protein [Bdellovibrio sp. NC01]|uniref:protein-glutamine glutaminase family protein n=1 Tax=Bdellovibrio sp. NC01 TaxID=2220073 RepID=UPI0011597091|nr:protein-glutamine glutaminase family protein [Bdellovibrio sp. NC01]QDK38554.1 hypothetical protein DOE51_13690 [Bdellovibrio sp. NC01]
MAILPLLVAGAVSAAERCEFALLGEEPSSYLEPSRSFIGNEFNLVLNDFNMAFIDKVVNRGAEITPEARAQFQAILKDLEIADLKLSKDVTSLLGRTLTKEQATALKLARALGRTEKGENKNLSAFSGNYTELQLERKDRILDLAGFSFEERAAIVGNKFVEDILTKYTAENLIWDNTAKTPEEAVAMNNEVLKQMNAESAATYSGKKINALDKQTVRKLYEEVTRHPVARLLKVNKYDPDHKMGFCFGRAMTAHLEALYMGIDKNSIRKVFVAGSMKAIVGDIIWQFHVATAVKSSDGGWWVIDPFVGKPVKLDQWYAKMYKQDTKGTLRLYVTEASRLGATDGARYNRAHLMEEYYNNYFKDLIQYYRLKANNELPKKSVWIKIFDWTLSVLRIGI